MPDAARPGPDERETRELVVATARALAETGLSAGTSGNVSQRWRDGFLITPSALPYDEMEPNEIVFVDADGSPSGARRPSTEWRFHHDIYAAHPELGGVVHAHPPFATTLAVHEQGIPAFHYGVAAAGGDDIRCARYAIFGSQELSDAVLDALLDRRACLMAHHGIIALGADLTGALRLAIEVEALAQQYWQALSLGPPPLLTSVQMADVIEKFADYRPD